MLPGSVCGLAVPRGIFWREALRGTTQAGCLAAPGAHIRDRYSIPHPAWKSDHISHPAGKHIVYGSPSLHDKLSPSAGADVVLVVGWHEVVKAPLRSAALRTRSGLPCTPHDARSHGVHYQGLGWGR